MKKLLAIGTAVLAGALVADTVESSNTFGVLKVTPSSTTDGSETVICVPWVDAGTTGEGQSIQVKNVVKTSNLKNGSELLQYVRSSKTYNGWVLTDGVWTGATSVTANGVAAASNDSATLSRGDALIIRTSWPENATDKNIYLYGQYQSTGIGTQTLTAKAWNLIAPPTPTNEAVALSSMTWANVNANDYMYVQTAAGRRITLTWSGTAWQYNKPTGASTTEAVIQPGQGAWYVSTGDTAPTVTFN